jgi:hypothetical protein
LEFLLLERHRLLELAAILGLLRGVVEVLKDLLGLLGLNRQHVVGEL